MYLYTWAEERGVGGSTIDYVITNEDSKEEIGRTHVGMKVESDHMPMKLDSRNMRYI